MSSLPYSMPLDERVRQNAPPLLPLAVSQLVYTVNGTRLINGVDLTLDLAKWTLTLRAWL